MTTPPGPVTVQLLADNTHLIPAVGEMRWREWGNHPGRERRDGWVEVTAREAGRDGLAITWVAIEGGGEAIGAVGLDAFDDAVGIAERRDRSPWVVGMIVRPDSRRVGVGRLLLARLAAWAGSHGYTRVWVATGDPATGFYQRCGWAWCETVGRAPGEVVEVLAKGL